jgi:hypothetical protein
MIIAILTFLIGIVAFAIWLYPFQTVLQTPPQSPQTGSLTPGQHKISGAEAVRLAEFFVIANGYTSLPPMEDKSKLSYESWRDSPPAEEALKRRHDTIESKAYGVMYEEKYGWSVVFRYNLRNEELKDFLPELKNVGRVVRMNSNGGNMRVEHQDFELSKFRRVKEVFRK